MAEPDRLLVPTPLGPARVTVTAPRRRRATLVLGHGAGGGIEARDLAALAAALPGRGTQVVLVEAPWRVAGRRVAGPPGSLDVAWRAVLAALYLPGPLVVGGRSAGARVACRTASDVGAAAVLALAFPLHPPGRPEKSRAAELLGVRVPLLVVQGERDAFGAPGELPDGVPVVTVPWADHGMAVPGRAPLTTAEALEVVVEAAAGLLAQVVGNRQAGGRG